MERYTPAEIRKMVESGIGKHTTAELNACSYETVVKILNGNDHPTYRKKPVINLTTGIIYESIAEASKAIGRDRTFLNHRFAKEDVTEVDGEEYCLW